MIIIISFLFLIFSNRPVSPLSYKVGQILTEPEKSDQSFDLLAFLIDNINVLVIILIGYLLTVVSILIISKLSGHRLNFRRLVALKKNRLVVSSKLGFLFFGFNLFLFFNIEILANLIKTESVMIDTEPFIDSIDKLKRTHKILLYHSEDKEIFLGGPPNRFLSLLFKDKLKNKEALEYSAMDKNFVETFRKNGDNFFFIEHQLDIQWVLASFSEFKLTNRIVFMDPKSYFDSFMVIHLRKNLDSKRKQIIHDK